MFQNSRSIFLSSDDCGSIVRQNVIVQGKGGKGSLIPRQEEEGEKGRGIKRVEGGDCASQPVLFYSTLLLHSGLLSPVPFVDNPLWKHSHKHNQSHACFTNLLGVASANPVGRQDESSQMSSNLYLFIYTCNLYI